MQWQLLPARACSAAEYAIGAQLEARAPAPGGAAANPGDAGAAALYL
ncbi:hypothetical protein [Streptomyces sp. NPDC054765]